jgi:signal transduction histidine kinase
MTDGAGPHRGHRAAASMLRHDLVNPINQILGYAELLVDDADRQGWASRAERLRSIREMGRRALESIDDALLREPDPDPGHLPDLQSLADGVGGLSDAIGEVCRTLEGAPSEVPDRTTFLDDLGRIREAAAMLSAMVRRVSVDEAETR